MKQTIIRGLLFTAAFLICKFVIHTELPALWGFIAAWVFEPVITSGGK